MNTSDKFSKLDNKKLLELLSYIVNENLKYRDGLDIDATFGIEIEYEGILKYMINRHIKNNFQTWKIKEDESLVFGSEIISPIMTDEIEYWKQIKEICKFLKRMHVVTNDNAAGHIHIGTHILGKDIEKWRKFLKTYTIYEDILFRFLYGDKISARKRILKYSKPISDLLKLELDKINHLEDINQIKNILPPYSKTQAINFMNIKTSCIDLLAEKNTIEFRSPNATVDEIVWQNNINTLAKLIINSKNIDESFLDYKISENENATEKRMYTYNEICLKKALEFTDLIFDKDIDKIYFLKQYIKKFKQSNSLPYEKKKVKGWKI
ncbi:MAG: amidoligase family protein [Bacilli bacterium]|nr:amidoligase family protein [Bacilli bacterium]